MPEETKPNQVMMAEEVSSDYCENSCLESVDEAKSSTTTSSSSADENNMIVRCHEKQHGLSTPTPSRDSPSPTLTALSTPFCGNKTLKVWRISGLCCLECSPCLYARVAALSHQERASVLPCTCCCWRQTMLVFGTDGEVVTRGARWWLGTMWWLGRW